MKKLIFSLSLALCLSTNAFAATDLEVFFGKLTGAWEIDLTNSYGGNFEAGLFAPKEKLPDSSYKAWTVAAPNVWEHSFAICSDEFCGDGYAVYKIDGKDLLSCESPECDEPLKLTVMSASATTLTTNLTKVMEVSGSDTYERRDYFNAYELIDAETLVIRSSLVIDGKLWNVSNQTFKRLVDQP